MKNRGTLKSVLISLLITVVFGAVYFYIALPPINVQSGEFWTFITLLCVVYAVATLIISGVHLTKLQPQEIPELLKKRCAVPVILIVAIIAFRLLGSVYSATIFHPQAYYELLPVESGDFSEDVAEISYDKIPMLDENSAIQLGRRALGSISTNSSLISQFEVTDEYSQINYNGRPVRVAPLKYGNLIKWFNNYSEGLPGYIIVDMVTQEADLIQLEEGMKYSESDHFQRNLYRHLRFNYPTFMFGDVNFEIDEEGTPWWVCSRVVKTIGIFGGEDICGAVLVNAITGECIYQEEVDSWVDRVYNADIVITQYNYHGALADGWINSWLGQKGVTTTTDGYNYIAQDDDVFLYTGVTSAGQDESNVGFILVNQRTKEARYYDVVGAEEYSAMSSAQGAVQHLNYSATFPILLNISDEPTYFMALKDSAQLVKMYAMVNVGDYQITATGMSVAECQENYEQLLVRSGIDLSEESLNDGALEVIGVVEEIRTAVVEGNTVFYFRLRGEEHYYAVSANLCETAVIVSVGDRVVIRSNGEEGAIIYANTVEISR